MKKLKFYRRLKYLAIVLVVFVISSAFFIVFIFGNDSILLWIPAIIGVFPLPLLITWSMLEELEKNSSWFINHNRFYIIFMVFMISVGLISLILGSIILSRDYSIQNLIISVYLPGTSFYTIILTYYIRKKGSEKQSQ